MSVIESGINFSEEQTVPQKKAHVLGGIENPLGYPISSNETRMSHYSQIEPLGKGIFKYHRRPDLSPLTEDSSTELNLQVGLVGAFVTVHVFAESANNMADRTITAIGRMALAAVNTLW